MQHRSFFEPATCPHCGAVLDAHMAVTADVRPEPGDISICVVCSGISEYTEDCQLRVPSDEALAAIKSNPGVQAAQDAVKAVRRGHA